MECDSCDKCFFSGGGGGGAKSTSKVKCLLFHIKTSGMPKRIKAVKNVELTIQILLKTIMKPAYSNINNTMTTSLKLLFLARLSNGKIL